MKKLSSLCFLILIFLFVVPLSFAKLEWHDCCNVELNEDVLKAKYDDYLKVHGWKETSPNQFVKNEFLSYEKYKERLYEVPKAKCYEKNDFWKTQYDDSYLFSNPDYLSKNNHFDFPVSTLVTVHYVSFTDGGFHGASVKKWVPSERFNYLRPMLTRQQVYERYKEIYEKHKITNGWFDSTSQTFIVTSISYDYDKIKAEVTADRNLLQSWTFYTPAGRNYVMGLNYCEEFFGFLNDNEVVYFPGQPKKQICKNDEIVDGCCPGYHQTNGVCCPKGFEGKTKEGVIVCDPIPKDEEIESVKILLDKTTLLLDGQDVIKAKLIFNSVKPDGTRGPYANKNIYRAIVAESSNPNYQFDVVKKVSQTNSKGELEVVIKLRSSDDIISIIDDINVYVYSMDSPYETRKDVFFTLAYSDLKILSIEQITSKDEVWQNKPVKFKVKLTPSKEKKQVTITSNGGTIKIDNIDYSISNMFIDGDEFEFIWFAPTLSENVRIDYTKRIFEGIIKSGLVVAGDSMSNKLDNIKNTQKLSERFQKFEKGYDSFAKVVNVAILEKDAFEKGKNIKKIIDASKESDSDAAYQLAKNGVALLTWMEGTVGLAGSPPTSGLLTSLKVGMTGLQEWYTLVDDMQEIANSEVVYASFPINIEVTGEKSKSKDSKSISVEVNGYKMLLDEKW